jgi:hypothetical protein
MHTKQQAAARARQRHPHVCLMSNGSLRVEPSGKRKHSRVPVLLLLLLLLLRGD